MRKGIWGWKSQWEALDEEIVVFKGSAMNLASRTAYATVGILRSDGRSHWVENLKGSPFGEEGCIWDGYVRHWRDQPVQGRLLKERDYETGKPIVLLWPADLERRERVPHFQLFLNERLTHFRGSRLGHAAVSVGGEVFNFSYRRNENEALPLEEYLYRPALGPFGIHPTLGRADRSENGRPYHHNFGRLFERSIHVLHVETAEEMVARLSAYFHEKMEIMRRVPEIPETPNVNPLFHYYRRNCATIIRDGLRRVGGFPVRGLAPRDLFESACRCFRHAAMQGECRVNAWRLRQLKVPEAPYSVTVPSINPMNWARKLLRAGTPIGLLVSSAQALEEEE